MICQFFTNMLEAKNQLDLQYNFDEKLEVIKDILIQEWGLNYNMYLKRSQTQRVVWRMSKLILKRGRVLKLWS